LILVWLGCLALAPLLLAAMLAQALLGSPDRAFRMAVAFDGCANALFGGLPTMTVSTRIGNALVEGKRWAAFAAPIIDFVFGKDHCLRSASICPNVHR
jgi:hypothetical protein